MGLIAEGGIHGMVSPRRKKKRVEIDPRVHQLVEEYAELRAMSVTAAIHQLLLDGLSDKGFTLPSKKERERRMDNDLGLSQ